MRKGILLFLMTAGIILAAGCGPNLQPQVNELQAKAANLEKERLSLQQQTASLQQDKTGLQTQVSSLQKDMASLQENSRGLQGDKDKLQTQTASLTKDKDSLQQDKGKLDAQVRTLKAVAGPLPASLDNFFPPKAPAPIYLFEMFALSGAFSGIGADLQQRDMPGVQKNYEAFKAQYAKMSGMVPEWKELSPTAPVEALGAALSSGDPAKIGPAMGQVGQVCGTCHLLNQTKAHQKYHWPDFERIKLTDPVTKQSMPWVDYMFAMAGAYDGIGNDLAQGQLDNARKNFDAFSARFKALPTIACVACHTTPRAYFVDASVQGMVDNLGKELSSAAPDPKKVGDLVQAVGNESCMKCHLVHFPAAQTKARWEKMADILK